MKIRRLLALAILLASVNGRGEEQPLPGGSCLTCHGDLDEALAKAWSEDVHAKVGLACVDCHGGDPAADDMDAAMSGKAGYRGVPKRAEIPKFCGRCHSDPTYMKVYAPLLPVDQLEKYWTSEHGGKLRKGDVKVAECVSCHGNHGIRKVNDPQSPVYASNLPRMCAGCHADAAYMAPYKIPTDQYEGYLRSVHGKALLEKGDVRGAPACNDCHGNHGATPPGLATITNVCGSCHAHNAELFLKSPMAKPLAREPLGECIACHGKHDIMHASDEWVGDAPDTLCMKCHTAGKGGGKFAGDVAAAISGFKRELDGVSALLEKAKKKGMDVMEGEDAFGAARQALIQSRTELHAFEWEPFGRKIQEGLEQVKKAEAFGLGALRENMTRRIGLAVSTVLLTLVIVGLALKIRTLPPK